MNTNNTLDLTPHFALDGDQPFKDRRAMMPFRGAIPVAKEQLAQTWQEMINQTVSPRKRLVYLHIPFCATHCTFCGYYRHHSNISPSLLKSFKTPYNPRIKAPFVF